MGNNSNKTRRIDATLLKPNGIYSDGAGNGLAWDPKIYKKFIQTGKLAPFHPYKTDEDELTPEYEECPICFFFFFPVVLTNRSVALKAFALNVI